MLAATIHSAIAKQYLSVVGWNVATRRTVRYVRYGLAVLLVGLAAVALATRALRQTPVLPELHRALAIRPVCPSADAQDYFFPIEPIYPWDAEIAATSSIWISRFLAAAEAKSISCGSDAVDTFRVARLNWNGTPQIATLTNGADDVTYRLTKLEGPSGRGAGAIVSDVRGAVDATAWQAVSTSVEQAGFWAWPTGERMVGTEPGDLWLIEGKVGRRYHAIVRFNPKAEEVTRLGNLIIRLAGG